MRAIERSLLRAAPAKAATDVGIRLSAIQADILTVIGSENVAVT
jgi:hypothetical protein